RCVEVEVVDPESAEHPGRAPDGGRDVVQLQVAEHAQPQVGEGFDRTGTGRRVELVPDLRPPDPGSARAGELDGITEARYIERDREVSARDSGLGGGRAGHR